MRAWILAFPLLVAGTLHAAGGATGIKAPPGTTRPPSLVLITVEGLRPDYLSCYGKSLGKPTPHIDQLASEGQLFEQVVTPSVSTLPSLATLMTGRTPFQHQVWDDTYRNRLSENETTLAELLKKNGYQTAAFTGSSRLTVGRGLDQGFDVFQDGYVPPPSGTWRLLLRSARTVVEAAKTWLAGAGEGPFFLWLHLVDPAVPGRGTATQPASDLAGTYAERLEALDSEVGQLLDALKARRDFDDLLVVLTADHGFGLGAHGESRAGLLLYDATLRVPLIVRSGSAAGKKGQRLGELAGLVDVFPTLEKLLGLPASSGLFGRDLFQKGKPASAAYHATALKGREMFGWAAQEALAEGKWRLLLTPAPELYDVSSDPDQKKDLSASLPGQVTRLKTMARKLSGGAVVPPAHFQEGPGPAPAFNRRLKEMGLVAASLEKALSRPLPDPRRFRDSWALMDEMQLRTEVAGYVAIQRVGDSLLKTDPGSLFALVGVGMLNLEPGGEGAKRSTELLRSAQQLYPLEPEVYHALSHLALLEKRYEDAAFLLQVALSLRPLYPSEIHYDLACAHARIGKKPAALAELRQSVREGFRDVGHIKADPDLESLRNDSGFKTFLEEEFPSAAAPKATPKSLYSP